MNQSDDKDYIIFDYENEKENILRLDRGVSNLIESLDKYVTLFEERSESLKNIFDITKNLDNSFMGWKNHKRSSSKKLQDINNNDKDYNNIPDEKKKDEFDLNKNSLILGSLFKKNISFKDNIQINVLENLKVKNIN